VTDSLHILVYSDDATVRQRVRDALGTRLHPDLPDLDHVEVATPAMVLERMHAGGIDLAVLDGEAVPAGGMGLARQLGDELDPCPPLVVLVARTDDGWLARWSGAEVAARYPLDPIRFGRQVLGLLSDRTRRS